MTNLVTLLRTHYADSNYESLGTFKSGFPVHNDNGRPGWKVLKGKLKLENIENLCRELCTQSGDISTLPNLLPLVIKVNNLWFKARNILFPREALPSSIHFSSKSEKYSFLSNFFPTLVLINNRIYPSSENAYQSLKLLMSGHELKGIATTSAKKAKKQNKHLSIESRAKLGIMKKVVHAKFSCNATLQTMLMNTRNVPLIEWTGSTFWGKNDQGKGTNFLGEILMLVRKNLTPESEHVLIKTCIIKREAKNKASS